MHSVSVTPVIKSIRVGLTKHGPEILTGLGIAGMVTTVAISVKATPKALKLLEEAKEKKEAKKLTPVETVAATWKCYIPSAILGGISTACLIGANSINLKRNAALATAYALSETALKEYQAKVKETIGEKGETAIREAVVKDKIDTVQAHYGDVVATIKGGNTFCCDVVFGRQFYSDMNTIKSAINKLNQRLMSEMYISLNDFYYELGMRPVKGGDDLGWNMENGLIDVLYSSVLTDDGRPCLAIEYSVYPRYEYQNLY